MNTAALFRISLLALAGLVAGATGARATDVVWTNTASGNWSSQLNWSPNQVPGTADNPYITKRVQTTN